MLGLVSAESAGRTVALDGDKQRTVLAALLLAQGAVVTDERLTALLWGWQPPTTSTKQLYTYVSRLRTRLGDAVRLERGGRGYRVDTGEAFFDWAAFRGLAEAAGADLRAGRPAAAERRYAAALALWRGPAVTGVTEWFAEAEAPRLAEARLAAVEGHAEAALALGGHAEVVPALTREVLLHPLRERLRGLLMTALHRCDRRADALAVYESGRRLLAEELGIDPGPALRALHQRVLTGTLSEASEAVGAAVEGWGATGPGTVAGPEPTPAPEAPLPSAYAQDPRDLPLAVPRQVPAAPADFTGRRGEVAETVGALLGRRDVLITGAPGSGKSALARYVAERCRDAFPDGLLHADLCSAAPARAPYEILGRFLRALGVAPAGLPENLDERVQLYRTRTAGRRMLVVLDGADDDAQVRPLLPGAGASRTVVTGVGAALGALEGLRPVRLGPLAPADAIRLLAAVAGPERIVAEPRAAVRIAELCDRVPLALRIAGARLAARPHWSVTHLADRLEPEERRLAELRFGALDAGAGLRAVLRGLPGELRETFTVLAAAGPRRFTAADAAPLLGVPAADAEEALARLADVRLLEGRPADAGPWPSYRVAALARLLAAGHGAAALTAA
ncbi:transcriptional regulator [Streptomyces sp. NBRC 14336]|uniref:AfsR/SARP family transcriptional regulator n=1 Tax=Streptomyces sp. NBRC 14336 TaxID=3030992 RepID=UPI002557A0BF|nr:transcriptional regulator [Streptomyces sp. NBRC 14336]